MTGPSLATEVFMFWALVGGARGAFRTGRLTFQHAMEIRNDLIMIAQHTTSANLRRRCGRAIMELKKMRAGLAA